MQRKHLLVILSLLFVIVYIGVNSDVHADEIDNNKMNEEIVQNENKKNALEAIAKSKEEIKQEIAKIDTKLNSIKEKQEYMNYPAIRLNVDTPIFGLVSVCNQKLKISSEVSTADVAKGYSIKDIIRTNSLKVPSFSVGSIVVITRDIKFDDTITLSDANTSILKLMQYLEQVKSVNEFLDKQIIKIYAEYIPKEKSDKINNLKSRLTEIENNQSDLDKNIIKLYISNLDDNKYVEYNNKYLEINNSIYNYRKVLDNVLINDDTLADYEKKVVELEALYLSLKQDVKISTENIASKIDFEKSFSKIRNDFVIKKGNIDKYIADSNIEKEITSQNNITEENENMNDISAVEEIKVYDVTSESIASDLNEKIEKLDLKITEILGQTILNKIKGIENTQTPEEVVNKEEVTNFVTKELTIEDKEKLLEELYSLYKEFLNSENKFYLDNVNLLLKDTTNKITNLSKYTDYSTISNIRYVYLELPKLLENDMKVYDLNNCIEITRLNSNMVEKLSNIVQINKVITVEYNNKISEDMKNSRESN